MTVTGDMAETQTRPGADWPPGGDHAGESVPSGAWLVIFTDVVALLLTFFVLLFAMKQIEGDRFEALTTALSTQSAPAREAEKPRSDTQKNAQLLRPNAAADLDYLAGIIEGQSLVGQRLAAAEMMVEEDRLVISLPGWLLFEGGSVSLRPEGSEALDAFGGILRHIGNQVEVHGHAAAPVSATGPGGSFDQNWNLSASRAIVTANALKAAGYTRGIGSFGYGAPQAGRPASLPGGGALPADRVDIIIRARKAE